MTVTFTIKGNGERFSIYGPNGQYLTYRDSLYDAECFIGFLSCTVYRLNLVAVVRELAEGGNE